MEIPRSRIQFDDQLTCGRLSERTGRYFCAHYIINKKHTSRIYYDKRGHIEKQRKPES